MNFVKMIRTPELTNIRRGYIIALAILSCQCTPRKDEPYAAIREYCDQIKVINTHEHQRWPEENGDLSYGFFHLLRYSYLMADVASAGGSWIDVRQIDTMPHARLWNEMGEFLDYTRNTSYYGHFIRGFQKLYGFGDPCFTEENTRELSSQIASNYSDYRTWFNDAFHRAGFELMFLDQYWKPFNTDIDQEHFALAFNINLLVQDASLKPEDGDEPEGIYLQATESGFPMATLADYLEFCDFLFQKNLDSKAVCVKNSMAYSRSLEYENVPFEAASELYDRPSGSLSLQERKMIQDHVFHWIIRKSIQYDLPIQIHTGYLAGSGNTLDNGRPLKLNNLFLQYPRAKFILFHGGYPWTGEYAAFGKMFPNVYLDLVWLPQISREEAIHALDEILDGTPYNKLFWGGDCAFIEEAAGSLEYGKDVVAIVLARRVERGLMTEELALEIAGRIFRENAIEVFQLEERLGRTF
jgi:hypothetical protein